MKFAVDRLGVGDWPTTAIRINMETGCDFTECADLAFPLYRQLRNGYARGASVMPLPASIEEWDAEHRTARKRANAARRDGYWFTSIAREAFEDDVYDINTSVGERQGRPMSAGYRNRPTFSPLPIYPCDRHALRTYGVLDDGGTLRAYTWVYRAGELVMFSTILGHADHLDRHVMYLLVRGAIEDQIDAGPGVCFYNLHDSGTDGLRFFKERIGFAPADVEWQL